MRSTIMRLGPAAEQVFDRLRQAIDDGELPAHSRLPAERDLCLRYGVNRGTLRRALARLEAEGRIATRRGSGSHVLAHGATAARTNIVSIMCGESVEGLPDLTRQALRRGCTLGIYSQNQMSWDSAVESLFLRRVKQQRHLGLLAACSPRPPQPKRLLRELAAAGTRIIHMEPYALEEPGQDFLLPDYRRAGYAAAVHLLMAGFRRIICITMAESGTGIQLAAQGARAAIQDQGLGPADRCLIADDPARGNTHHMAPAHEPDAARLAWDQLLASLDGPTGFVVPACNRAVETVKSLAARGVTDCRVASVDMGPAGYRISYSGYDYFSFDRPGLYRRAMDLVTARDHQPIREWVAPVLHRAPA